MKLKALSIVFLCAIFLTSCGNGGLDKETAKLLSSDPEVVDFVLGGKVYTHPLSVEQFTKNGWVIDDLDGENPNQVSLPNNQRVNIDLDHEDFETSIEISISNKTGADIKLTDSKTLIDELSVYNDEKDGESFFVIKGGITPYTTKKQVEKVDVTLSPLYNIAYDGNAINIISIGERNYGTDFLDFETAQQREKNIANKKDSLNEEWSETSYSAVVKELKDSDTTRVGFHESLKIYDKGQIANEMNPLLSTGDVFLAKDSAGNIYAIEIEESSSPVYVPWSPSLKVGDSIEMWGNIKSGLKYDQADGSKIPLITSSLVEKGGKIIYRNR